MTSMAYRQAQHLVEQLSPPDQARVFHSGELVDPVSDIRLPLDQIFV